jgi:hypothetical protein
MANGDRRHAKGTGRKSVARKGAAVSKSTRNSGKPWTPTDVKDLKQLAKENTPTRVIGLKLGRTEDAVRNRASQEDVSLKPTNQRPYGTKKR